MLRASCVFSVLPRAWDGRSVNKLNKYKKKLFYFLILFHIISVLFTYILFSILLVFIKKLFTLFYLNQKIYLYTTFFHVLHSYLKCPIFPNCTITTAECRSLLSTSFACTRLTTLHKLFYLIPTMTLWSKEIMFSPLNKGSTKIVLKSVFFTSHRCFASAFIIIIIHLW